MSSLESHAKVMDSSIQTHKLDSMEPKTLDQMLRYRAQLTPDATILWYPSSGTDYVPYTASQINTFVDIATHEYSYRISRRTTSNEKPKVIALLGLADLDYVVSMFAIYRLGHTVLALSPRLARQAHEHLINSLGACDLIYHSSQDTMAEAIGDSILGIELHPLVRGNTYRDVERYRDQDVGPISSELDMNAEGAHVAIIIHSSGSTGLPKPSKLIHKVLVTTASKNMNMRAFSCVPFFHGFGLNGLHRGIYSGHDFFFYNAAIPLTSKYLIESIMNHNLGVFFCVPYALKLLAETTEGIEALKKCKLVWFAGSACPDDLGDSLTSQGIKLISDYGLSECGPLMTTMRPDSDQAWNYLRPLPHSKPYMIFEERGGTTFELVCLDGLPWKSTSNRDDGSYATKDLFEKHPELADAYRFISRLDDTLVLSNGEKANPTILEGKTRQHHLIAEAVVFGTGKAELGLAIIKAEAAKEMSDDQMLDQVWPLVAEAQREMPEHARIVRSMVVVLPSGTQYPRTDKGTVIRQQFYQKFSQEIENSYSEDSDSQRLVLAKDELESFIRDEVLDALNMSNNQKVGLDTDLFHLGVDSLQSTQLRRRIQGRIDLGDTKLPFNVVYEHSTVRRLADYILGLTSGCSSNDHSPHEAFETLLGKHGNFNRDAIDAGEQHVVLTGATGSLGAHLLKQLLLDRTVKRVYCLARASSDQAASERIIQSLQSRNVWKDLKAKDKAKIIALASDFVLPGLGLEAPVYWDIAQTVTTVIHAAWPVNFNMSLASFEPDIIGTKNLLQLCLLPQRTAAACFVFCSSISTAMKPSMDESVEESVPADPSQALVMGYAQSKLVAENMCIRAAHQTGVKTYIMRIGQVVGDTEHGIWNPNEAVPMMMQTASTIGGLPDIEEVHRWLPVDTVAKTIVEVSLPAQAATGTVLNIINPASFRWKSDLLPELHEAGSDFEIWPVTKWLEQFRKSDEEGRAGPPARLLSYFETTYGGNGSNGRGENRDWATENASRYSPTFRAGWHLSRDWVQKFVTHFRENGWNPHTETYKDRSDSVATLVDTDTATADEKVFWNDQKKRFDVRDVDSQPATKADVAHTGRQADSMKVDEDAIKSHKVVTWAGTKFEFRDPRPSESPLSGSPSQGSLNSSADDVSTLDDLVVVPKEGEIVWDANSNRFEINHYKDVEKASQPKETQFSPCSVDIEALKQPKTLTWDGTRFTANCV